LPPEKLGGKLTAVSLFTKGEARYNGLLTPENGQEADWRLQAASRVGSVFAKFSNRSPGWLDPVIDAGADYARRTRVVNNRR